MKFPSISAWGLGRFLGMIYDCIPTRIWGVKLSHLLFVLPSAPVAAALYLMTKLFGDRYVLTNRSVQRWTVLGNRQLLSVPLTEIADVEINPLPGQEFFRAADVVLANAKGDPLTTLQAVPHPEVFREWILKARDARSLTEESLATIAARS